MKKNIYLAIAIMPTIIVICILAWIYFNSSGNGFEMTSPIWGLAAFQAAPIIIFSLHAVSNKDITPEERWPLLVNFIVLIPFGMITYCNRFIFDDSTEG